MHKERTSAPWLGRGRGVAVWGAWLGEQAMHLVRLSPQAGAHSVRVQAFEQAQAQPAPDAPDRDAPNRDVPWWWPHMRRIARPSPSLGSRWRWPWAAPDPLALAWSQACCQQGELLWPGAADAPALQAEVHLEAATALGLPPADVAFDFQTRGHTHAHVHAPAQTAAQDPMHETWALVAAPRPPTASASRPVPDLVPDRGSALLSVHWAASAREDLLSTQRRLRAAGWRATHIEPEALAARRAAECLLGEPGLPWAVPVRDWQFAQRAQRSLSEAAWRALQDSPHWGPLAACGAALGVMA